MVTESTIYSKLIEIMRQTHHIAKRPGEGLPYPYIAHDDVTALLGPLLIENKVVVLPTVIDRSWHGNRCSLSVRLTFVDAENPDSNCTIESVGDGQGNSDKEAGKAYSYAVKMALLKVFFMSTGERDVENEEIKHAMLPAGTVRHALDLIGKGDALEFKEYTDTLDDDEKIALWKEFNVQGKEAARALLKEARDSLDQ